MSKVTCRSSTAVPLGGRATSARVSERDSSSYSLLHFLASRKVAFLSSISLEARTLLTPCPMAEGSGERGRGEGGEGEGRGKGS